MSSVFNIHRSKYTYLIAIFLLIFATALFIFAFEQFPLENTSLAIDWYAIYPAIKGGTIHYGGSGLRNPPWAVLPVLPLGLLSFRASWGLLNLLTFAVLMVSVPRKSPRWLWLTGVILLVVSFPALRHAADANFEGLVIGGILLLLSGYKKQNIWFTAIGFLLASGKIQETWLLLLVAGIFILKTWDTRQWLQLAGVGGAILGITGLWRGREWWSDFTQIPQLGQGSLMDSSLLATFHRLGLPMWLFVIIWILLAGTTLYIAVSGGTQLTREKTGTLVAASLLLAPYAAGNSFLTVLAIGIIPLLFTQPIIATILIILVDVPYFTLAHPTIMYHYGATYWTLLLFIAWGAMMLNVYQSKKDQAHH